MLFGPHSPIGNYSAISVAEVQCNYIIQQMCWMRDSNNDLIEADLDATNELQDKMKKGLTKTVWLSGCASWYMDDRGNVPMWPWTFERFESELSKINTGEFHLCKRAVEHLDPNRLVVTTPATPQPAENVN
jgi:hypothetical protein